MPVLWLNLPYTKQNKIMRKFTMLCLILFPILAMGQKTVTGKIFDADSGQPLLSASVTAKGTSKGVTTGAEGTFSITVNNSVNAIVISYVGYTSQTINISGPSTFFSVGLVPSAQEVSVTVIGSRGPRRISTETAVPVDVLNMAELKSAPQVNLNQILNYVAPSFTSNTTTVADGTDHIDPAQLRGLGPDQVLVLLNGKRRHTSSLVNVNGTPGRGSVGTDLNAIPAFAIERIEVLRDGAAAQYGSDAIAGVINVVMKKSVNKFTGSVYGAGNFSKGANDFRGGVDGAQYQVDLNYGVSVGKKGGFINLTGSGIIREGTRRATDFNGNIFNAYNAVEARALTGGTNLSALFSNINNTPNTAQIISTIKQYAPQVTYLSATQQTNIQNAATIGDLQGILNANVTDNELAYRGLERRDFNMRIGQSKLASGQFFMNSEIPVNDKHTFYTFGGYGLRHGNAAGFYRRPNQNRTLTEIYPNGFLPEIASDITDISLAVGIRGKAGNGWTYDLSNTFGRNQFKYTIDNTSNATQGIKSATKFDAGKLAFLQNTANLDIARNFDVMAGLNFAFGGELRMENYKISAGAQDSYEKFDIDGNASTPTTPALQSPTDFFGSARPGGAQVFPGFRPENALSKGRTSGAGYVDVELNPTKAVLLNAALRYENYSDFGSTFNYKFATRVKIAQGLNLRGAIATGFRAPSLQQKYYNSTATQFIGGIGYEVGTFTNESKPAKLFGIPNLKQEDSHSYSAGFTYKVPNSNLTFTVDGYFVKINNRIVLTGQFNRPGGTPTGDLKILQEAFDQANATQATFFTNAINTESKGIDFIVSNRFKFDKFSLKTDIAGTVSKTNKVGGIAASDILKNTGNLNNYFSESSRIFLESAVPRTKLAIINTLDYGNWQIFMRQTYFGSVVDPNTADINGDGIVQGANVNGQFIAIEHPTFDGRVITDFSVAYTINKSYSITVGANNIFDLYPDRNLKTQTAANPLVGGGYGNAGTIDLSNNNQFEFSRNVSQFGFNGRLIFARLNITL